MLFCRGLACRMLTHLQAVPFAVRRATAGDVETLLELQNDCQCTIQARLRPTLLALPSQTVFPQFTPFTRLWRHCLFPSLCHII